MGNYVLVGKIVNSFGIKGELKIISDFEYKDRVFKKDSYLYIGQDKTKELISNYRVHKNYDLITFSNYTNINEILKYKGLNVYIKREELELNDNEYLLSDLIGLEVFDSEECIGLIVDYLQNNGNILLKVSGATDFYIPLYSHYIKTVDVKNKRIITDKGSELII